MRLKNREIRDREVLKEIIDKSDCVRIAMHAGDFPYIVPLNFGYVYEDEFPVFYFHSARAGRKLDLLREDNRVGFEMDCDHAFRHMDRGMHCTMDYRSIMGTGVIEFVEEPEEYAEAVRLILEHHGSKHDFPLTEGHIRATAILKLKVLSMTGKEKKPGN